MRVEWIQTNRISCGWARDKWIEWMSKRVKSECLAWTCINIIASWADLGIAATADIEAVGLFLQCSSLFLSLFLQGYEYIIQFWGKSVNLSGAMTTCRPLSFQEAKKFRWMDERLPNTISGMDRRVHPLWPPRVLFHHMTDCELWMAYTVSMPASLCCCLCVCNFNFSLAVIYCNHFICCRHIRLCFFVFLCYFAIFVYWPTIAMLYIHFNWLLEFYSL